MIVTKIYEVITPEMKPCTDLTIFVHSNADGKTMFHFDGYRFSRHGKIVGTQYAGWYILSKDTKFQASIATYVKDKFRPIGKRLEVVVNFFGIHSGMSIKGVKEIRVLTENDKNVEMVFII